MNSNSPEGTQVDEKSPQCPFRAPLAKYKDALGKPHEGVHKPRLGGLAVTDILATLVVAIILKLLIPKLNVFLTFIGLWGVGIGLHLIFGVCTPITKFITRGAICKC